MFKRIEKFANQAFINNIAILRYARFNDTIKPWSDCVLSEGTTNQLLEIVRNNGPKRVGGSKPEAYKTYVDGNPYGLVYVKDLVFIFEYNIDLKDDRGYVVTNKNNELFVVNGDELSFTKEEGKFEISCTITDNIFLLEQDDLPKSATPLDKLYARYDGKQGIIRDKRKLEDIIGKVCKVLVGKTLTTGYIFINENDALTCYTGGNFYEAFASENIGVLETGEKLDYIKLDLNKNVDLMLKINRIGRNDIPKVDAILTIYEEVTPEFLEHVLKYGDNVTDIDYYITAYKLGQASLSI